MEFLTILLSSLIGIISPAGFVLDRTAEKALRSQFVAVEQLHVRIDNAPSYQLVKGKVERIRIAGRGLMPVAEVRLAALELETDPIQLRGLRLKGGKPQLAEPLRTAVRLVITPADVNRAVRSPTVIQQLRKLGVGVLDEQTARQVQRYELLNPRVEFLPNQRVRVQVQLREAGDTATLEVLAETGLEVSAGRQLRLLTPKVTIDGELVPDQILTSIADGIAERSDLRQLEPSGITSRILKWNITPEQFEMAVFVQVAPDRL